MREGKFGTHEAIWLLTITISAKVFFSGPSLVATIVGTAGWYMSLISACVAFLALMLIFALLNLYPGKTLMEIYDTIFGTFGGSLFSLTLFTVLFVSVVVPLREFIDVLKVYVLPASPPSYLLAIFISVISTMAFLGLETLARFAKLVAYVLLSGYVIVILLSSQLYEIYRLFPVLGYGLGKTVLQGVLRSSSYGEIVIIGIIIASVHNIKYAKRAAGISLVLSAIITSTALLAFSLAFPYYTGQEITAPIYLMASLIEYGKVIQRIEPVFFFVWIISTVISVAVLFYASLIVYLHVFRLDDKRPLIIPFGIIMLELAMVPISTTQLINNQVQLLREYGGIFFFLPPAIALAVAKLRGLKGGTSNA